MATRTVKAKLLEVSQNKGFDTKKRLSPLRRVLQSIVLPSQAFDSDVPYSIEPKLESWEMDEDGNLLRIQFYLSSQKTYYTNSLRKLVKYFDTSNLRNR